MRRFPHPVNNTLMAADEDLSAPGGDGCLSKLANLGRRIEAWESSAMAGRSAW
jgi:hypothetical protein